MFGTLYLFSSTNMAKFMIIFMLSVLCVKKGDLTPRRGAILFPPVEWPYGTGLFPSWSGLVEKSCHRLSCSQDRILPGSGAGGLPPPCFIRFSSIVKSALQIQSCPPERIQMDIHSNKLKSIQTNSNPKFPPSLGKVLAGLFTLGWR